MATVALIAAGVGTGGWGFLAYAAAGYIDQQLVGKFFGGEGQRTRPMDIRLQGTQEGTAMTFLAGPEVRVSGQVLWKSAVRSVQQGGGGGGCGQGPAVPSTYAYYADCAIAIGQPPAGARIVEVDKMWFDGKVGWKFSPDVDITSTLLSVSLFDLNDRTSRIIDAHTDPSIPTRTAIITEGGLGLQDGMQVSIAGATGATSINGLWVVSQVDQGGVSFDIPTTPGGAYTGGGIATRFVRYQQINSPNGGPDLSQLRVGYDVVVSGFANPNNNGTFRCWESGRDDVLGTSYVKLINPNAVVVASGVAVTLHQDLPQFNPKYFTAVTIHDGSPWQLPDSTMEAALGVGNVPGYHGIAYVVIDNVNLTAFGDRIPNVNFLVQVETSLPLSDAISALMARADYGTDEYDVSALTAITCRGYQVQGIVTTSSCLAALMTTFDVLAFERDGQIVFIQRRNAVVRSIPAADLVAHQYGADAPRKCRIREARDRDLPREFSVNYFNPAKDYQTGNEPARLSTSRGDSPETFDSGITMSASNAQSLAMRLLYSSRANSQVVEVRLPPKYSDVQEGAVLSFVDLGRTWTMLAASVDFNVDGTITVSGPQDEAAALNYAGDPATGGGTDSGGVGVLEELDLQIIDIAPFSEGTVQTPGLYWATSPRSPERFFPGSDLFDAASDVDSAFIQQDSTSIASKLGYCATALGGGVSGYWIDRKNTVDVVMESGFVPASSPEDDVLTNGKNVVIIGNEVMQYVTATLVATNMYRLSNLIRGLRDTDDQIDLHFSSERVVFLGGTSVKFLERPIADVGLTKFYRSVPIGGVVEDYPSVTWTFVGGTVRPFSPRAVQGTRDSSLNLTITWDRQTRSIVKAFSTNQIPLNESRELYEIDVMDANDVAVKRTISVSGATTASYSAANQTTDFGSAQASIRLRLYQIGDFVGRGRARRATV